MRNLLRNRRGSVAFATVVALVPLIGAVAIGAEAGSWYVTKQHAQNAADAAAYSGGLRVLCDLNGACADGQDYVYRGKQFAAQNTFCDGADHNTYPGSKCGSLSAGTTRSVAVTRGDYAAGTFTANAGGSAVKADVTQTQPYRLASVLVTGNVTIASTAIAAVKTLANPCVLALKGPITFQDNGISVTSPTCGFGSNFTGPGASIDFKNVSPSNVSLGQSAASGSCSGTAALCQKVQTYSAPVTDPYTALNAALSALTLPVCGAGPGGAPVAYTAATPCANKNYSLNGSTCSPSCPLKGTYFFSGTDFSLKGNSSSFGTDPAGATIILLPGVTTGKSNHVVMNLKAPTAVPTVLPASLLPYAALIGATAFYDTETDAQKFTGITSITVTNGIMYYPNLTLTFSGNSNILQTGCSELIAKQITFAGSVNFTNQGCPQSFLPTSKIVTLVK
jgi:hypothetical protein